MIATEGGHWYTQAGEPCYTIKGLNGRERNTTLADARKLKLVPSVTEVMKVLAKPGLERWKIEQVALAALTLPKIENETMDQFLHRVYVDANKQSNDARNLGTSIHTAIERFYLGKKINEHQVIVHALDRKLKQAFAHQSWLPEKSFCHPLGYGGKIDLHSQDWVIDYKTKEFGPDDIQNTFSYYEHKLQLSAYKLGLGLPNARIANVFISRTHPGLIKIEKHKDDLSNTFRALLAFWNTLKKIDR
ncbi:MAG: hypothetical protein ACC707_19600 [Thiohalomonadales bacterium]